METMQQQEQATARGLTSQPTPAHTAGSADGNMPRSTSPSGGRVSTIDRARDKAQLDAWVDEALASGAVSDEATGGALPDYLAELQAMADLDFRTKMERLGLAIVARQHDTAAIDLEIARLTRRKQGVATEVERMKAYAMLSLGVAGETTVKTALVTVRMQRNSSPSVAHALDGDALKGLHAKGTPWVKEVPATFALDSRAVATAYMARRAELVDEAQAGTREIDIAATLAAEFPTISATVGAHLRVG